MLDLLRKRSRAVLCALAAVAAPLLVPGVAAAQEDECTFELTGPEGSGSVTANLEEPAHFVVSFAGIDNPESVGIYADDVLVVTLADGGVTSPVEVTISPEDGEELGGLIQGGAIVTVKVIGDTTLTGNLLPCIGLDEEGFIPACILPLAGEGAGSGEFGFFVKPATMQFKLRVTFDGIASHTGVGVYALDENGDLADEIVNLAAADAPSPVVRLLAPEEIEAINEAQDGNGVLVVVSADEDSISANPADCDPEEGEGDGDGEGEGVGMIEGEGEGSEGEGEGSEGEPAAPGYIRIIHGATAQGDLDICINGEIVGGAASPFGTITDALAYPSEFYSIGIFVAGEGCGGVALATTDLFLAEGASFTIAIADILGKADGVQLFVVADNNGTVDGFAKVRAFNLSSDNGTVDIYLDDVVAFDDLAFGPSDYTNIVPGNYIPTIRDGSGTNVLATGSSIALGDGGVYTIYALGLSEGEPALNAASSNDVDGLPVEGEEGEGEGAEGEGEGAVEGEGEGAVEGEGEGAEGEEGEGEGQPIDFCAVQDELAGIVDDPILGPVLTDLLGEDIAILAQLACDVADLNGELPVFEGEEEADGPSINEQLPGPNGLLDGPFELAVLAELINNPGAYTNLAIDASLVGPAFEENLAIALGNLAGVPPSELAPLFALLLGDALEGEVEGEEVRDEIILRAAGLVPNIGLLLAGYITLGDDNSVATAVLVLSFINDATDGILGLGVDPNAYNRLGAILSADGDIDGDGCTQRAEFEALGENPDTAAYLAAVLDPGVADCPAPIDFCAVQDDLAGLVVDPVIGPVLADLLGEDIAILEQLACDVADLNGPLPVFEGEEEADGPSIAEQLPLPNGILDGPFELAVLAELINNPGAHTGLAVDAALVGAAFEENLAIALGTLAGIPPEELAPLFALLLGDALEGEIEGQGTRDEIVLRAAGLVPNIGLLLTGYATLGDENSVAVATLVLGVINDATDGILGLGVDPNAYNRLDAILSINGDVDGDGCTQGQEYAALAEIGPVDSAAYIATVLNPAQTPANCEAEGEGEGGEQVQHKGDTDGNGRFDLSELLRVVQLYNAGAYTCSAEPTEDGYQVGDDGIAIGVGVCVAHDIDFAGDLGVISLSELLRAIQLFNLSQNGVLVFTGLGEDGWDVAGK
jgi:hypothetical protein